MLGLVVWYEKQQHETTMTALPARNTGLQNNETIHEETHGCNEILWSLTVLQFGCIEGLVTLFDRSIVGSICWHGSLSLRQTEGARGEGENSNVVMIHSAMVLASFFVVRKRTRRQPIWDANENRQ